MKLFFTNIFTHPIQTTTRSLNMKKLLLSFILFCLSFSTWAQISLKKSNGGFLILDHHQEVAFYQKAESSTMRNNFLHPVFLPGEIPVTQSAPDNHRGQSGIFWGWSRICIQGRQICNSWDANAFIDKIKTVEFSRDSRGNGVLSVTGYWSSPNFRGGEYEFMKEQTTMVFHQQTGNYRQIDFHINLFSRVNQLELGHDSTNQAGGFAIRMKMPRNVHFYSEKGKLKPGKKVVKAQKYVGLQGTFGPGNKQGGIIIYAAPCSHSEEDQQWLLNRREGLQNALFPSTSAIALHQGHPLVLNYSLILYNGKINLHHIIRVLEQQ